MKRGIFVVIEGLDRCGKSTQLKNSVEYFKENKIECIELTFPDRTTLIGKQINDYLQNKNQLNDETIHLLYSLNRWEKK
jgi:dTMP kinase